VNDMTSNVAPGSPADSRDFPPRHLAATDRVFWSIRRELWENRSLTIAPLAVGGFALFITVMTAFGLPRRVRTLPTLDAAHQHLAMAGAFSLAPSLIMVATILVGIFYSLDALYGERRDRSILFWKSLPVSDRTTVLSKAAIPLVLLPLIGFALSVASQLILLLWGSVVLMISGMSPAPLWAEVQLLGMPVSLLYGIGAFTLWHAPLYGWMLMISGWAKRTPALGFPASGRRLRLRARRFRHLAFREVASDGSAEGRFQERAASARWPSRSHRSVRPAGSPEVREHARSVDRAPRGGGIHRGRDTTPPLSGADVSGIRGGLVESILNASAAGLADAEGEVA
jgi:ABC-2 type transport system permease protein